MPIAADSAAQTVPDAFRHLPTIGTSIAPNLPDRRFNAPVANSEWAEDFTYRWTAEDWLYVALVMDLFSQRAVAGR